MAGKVILGAGWGDEGKGKYIDILSSEVDMVVRSQGGNNAGHTVVVGDDIYKLHLVPSGILYKGCTNIIAAGVVLDPQSLLAEIDNLKQMNISTENLFIDERVHIIMPWHIAIDKYSETMRGTDDIGTTKKGIGPCYMDKTERIGIRMHDLLNPDKMEDIIRRNCEIKNKIITHIYNETPLNVDEIIENYKIYAGRLKSYVCDTSVMIHDYIKYGKDILFEGAQGTLLDLDMGTYPYVTSSHPITGGCLIGSGVGPNAINEVIGVCKAYITRVGKGPFPTELNCAIGESIRENGGEFGTTTGRPRRTGWFDAVIARYAVRVNGLTHIVINKIDPLRGIGKLLVCVDYMYKGERISHFPADISKLEECVPIYEEFDGFDEDISACKTFEQLPLSVRKYIRGLEKICNCPVKYIGVGPDRNQIIEIK